MSKSNEELYDGIRTSIKKANPKDEKDLLSALNIALKDGQRDKLLDWFEAEDISKCYEDIRKLNSTVNAPTANQGPKWPEIYQKALEFSEQSDEFWKDVRNHFGKIPNATHNHVQIYLDKLRGSKEEMSDDIRIIIMNLEKALKSFSQPTAVVNQGQDISDSFARDFTTSSDVLPNHSSLRVELGKITKIPVSNEDWEMLRSHFNLATMNKYFSVNDKHCKTLLLRIAGVIFSPLHGSTKFSYIPFWDGVMGSAAGLFGKKINRNTSQNTSTGQNRPDWVAYERNHGIFCGEEKGDDPSAPDPKIELSTKLEWNWKGIPYVFGYSAVSTIVKFHYIMFENGTKTVNEMFEYDFSSTSGRLEAFHVVCAIFRLFEPLFKSITNDIQSQELFIQKDLHEITSDKGHIIKKFLLKQEESTSLLEKLNTIYGIIDTHKIPFCERKNQLKWQAAPNQKNNGYLRLKTSPHGYLSKPNNKSEIIACLICVLTALDGLHSHGIVH
eukprot:TRINITY_DN6061_c0_g2_i4.p1 TRINITY_DN6061_c0_g2~~TRINITY_DN6061_c0_g2_i4.p1  ORF type:complete len:498 (+),score=86.28 TRINITY_DN6061_c0_g2_i4:47-1540(+)